MLETVEKGYRLNGQVLRPARVVVSAVMAAARLLRGARGLEVGLAGRDQEGLPRACPQVASGPQPGRPAGGGALQGDPAGLRHPLGRREAQAVRRRRPIRRLRRGRLRRRRLPRRRRASPRTSATSSPPSSAGRQQGPREQRGRDLETEVRLSLRPGDARHPDRGLGADDRRVPDLQRQRRQARHHPAHLPALRGHAASTPRARASSRSPSPARSAAARARSSRTPARPATGSGVTQETKRYRVNIPAGVHDGSRIRLAGKGEAGYRGGPPGDLYVTTRVAPSPVFKQRPDGNLEVDLPVTVTEAIQGGDIEVPTLNGSKTIRIAPGTQHGTVQRLRGEGPPRTKGSGRGDIHYRIRIDVPRSSPTSSARRSSSSPSRSTAAIRALAARRQRPVIRRRGES